MVLYSLVAGHGRAMLYFESPRGLSHCAGSTRTARFLRRAVERVTGAGGTVVVDVDPSAHAASALRLLSAPFDRQVGSTRPVPRRPRSRNGLAAPLRAMTMHHVRFRDPDGTVRTGGFAPEDEEIVSHPSDAVVALEPERFDPSAVEFLPPCEPTKVVCVGLNYADHAAEQGKDVPDRPLLFLKPPNAVAGHGDTLSLLPGKERIDHEAELAVVVGERATDLREEEAMAHVAGFTCLNDLSNRDDQRREQNWVRGKAFDDSCPIGPVVATPDEVPGDAAVRCRLNGETVQDSTRDQFIFSVPELLAEITQYLTLEPGDVVSTGTPAGVGPVSDGDTVEVEVEGVGTLRNHIEIP